MPCLVPGVVHSNLVILDPQLLLKEHVAIVTRRISFVCQLHLFLDPAVGGFTHNYSCPNHLLFGFLHCILYWLPLKTIQKLQMA